MLLKNIGPWSKHNGLAGFEPMTLGQYVSATTAKNVIIGLVLDKFPGQQQDGRQSMKFIKDVITYIIQLTISSPL